MGSGQVTFCGWFDNTNPNLSLSDSDHYRVDVPGAPLFAHLTASTLPVAGLDDAFAKSQSDLRTSYFGGDGMLDRYSALRKATNQEVNVVDYSPGPAVKTEYMVTVVQDDCVASSTPSFLEELDTSSNQHAGNDTYIYHAVLQRLNATGVGTDQAEITGLTVAINQTVGIAGSLANVPGPIGDEYQDRDTYSLSTGAAASYLLIRVSWADSPPADIDVVITIPGSTFIQEYGLTAGDLADEVTAVPVQPNTVYDVFVGARENPAQVQATEYMISVCGR